jgi:isocitrate dehydrogenase kinase/phosphatase
VGKYDVFPETFGPFLLGDPRVRQIFMQHHGDLLDVEYWQTHKERIQAGYVHDVFPYDRSKRFKNLLGAPTDRDADADEFAPVDEPVDVQPMGASVHDQGRLTGFTTGGTEGD